jgi:DNA invertase Pin-like site-specific DNA recombinase
MNARLAYVRVSTISQNESRQLEALKLHDIAPEHIYIDKASAKDTERPKLKELLTYARKGDTIYIHSFDRLARNTKDLLHLVEHFNEQGITLISIKENLDTSIPQGKMMLTMLGAIAEFERAMIKERQLEGIAIAKEQGKFKGGKAKQVDNFQEHYDRYMKREVTKVSLAKELSISRVTLDKMIREHEQGLAAKTA